MVQRKMEMGGEIGSKADNVGVEGEDPLGHGIMGLAQAQFDSI